MKTKDLQHLLADFDPTDNLESSKLTNGKPLTVWLSAGDKARYDRLQQMSKGRMSKKLREVIIAVLDHVEEKAS
jgi:hypothetical protein